MKNKIINNYLEQLELSPLEIKVYLLLLESEALSARAIIQELQVNRTSIYPPLDFLFEKGLITKIVDGTQTKYAINDPENSLRFMQEEFVITKKQKLQELETTLPTIIKQFSLPTQSTIEVQKSETKFYKGKAGIKKIYADVLKAKEQRSYVDITKIVEVFPENFALFNNKILKDPKVRMYEIFQYASKEQTDTYLKFVSKHKNYSYKILPKGTQLTAQDILIYDNNVAIISFSNGISGVVLQNADLYTNFKTLFDVMWNLLPEIKN